MCVSKTWRWSYFFILKLSSLVRCPKTVHFWKLRSLWAKSRHVLWGQTGFSKMSCAQQKKAGHSISPLPTDLSEAPAGAVSRACLPEHIMADQSTAGLCKAEGANRLTTSDTKCITVHLLLTRIDGLHCPVELWGFFNMDVWLLSPVSLCWAFSMFSWKYLEYLV